MRILRRLGILLEFWHPFLGFSGCRQKRKRTGSNFPFCGKEHPLGAVPSRLTFPFGYRVFFFLLGFLFIYGSLPPDPLGVPSRQRIFRWRFTKCAIKGFYWVFLPSLTGFYWVLLGFSLVLLGFTGFYWVLLGFTGFYWVLLGFAFESNLMRHGGRALLV